MSLFDRVLNAAADAATSSGAQHRRGLRRHEVDEQILAHRQAIQWATSRLGRLALNAAAAGGSLPPQAQPAADAVRRWEAELGSLHQQLAHLDRQPGAPQSGPPG